MACELRSGPKADSKWPAEIDEYTDPNTGENEIEIHVANMVANHFAQEVTTRYVYDGQTASGLLGPVELRVLPATSISIER